MRCGRGSGELSHLPSPRIFFLPGFESVIDGEEEGPVLREGGLVLKDVDQGIFKCLVQPMFHMNKKYFFSKSLGPDRP